MSIIVTQHIVIVLALVFAVSVIFRKLHLPMVLGYLVAGAILGPHALKVINDLNTMKNLAVFGVVFMMFTVGLEFSLPKLIALRRSVLLLGGLQVIITITLTFFIAQMFGLLWHAALVFGGVIAMSSTAVVIKQLSEHMQINTKHGLNAIGILLFQDLAVIPLLILITSPLHHHISAALPWSLLKAGLAIGSIFIIGRWVLQPLFRLTASTKVIELFTLLALLVAISSGWLTNSLGMSFSLGAFLAGIMLGETKYRNQIEVEIRPFRDILMGIFFIAIGMLLDFSIWQFTWYWIVLLFLAIVVGKSLLITLLGKIFGDDLVTSLRSGIILAQGGEFGFALLTVALNNHIITHDYAQILLGALILSIAVAPIIIDYNYRIVSWILPRASTISLKDSLTHISAKTENLHNHIILCGYGRVGQNIAHMLHQEKIPFFVLDLDPGLIQNASLIGEHISYGDCTHPEILKAAGIDQARALVTCFDDVHAAIKILQHIRSDNGHIPIIVRCKNDNELATLKPYHATRVIVESQEESLMMTYHLLLALHFPHQKAAHFIQDVRQKHADLLEQVFSPTIPLSQDMEEIDNTITFKQLRPILIPAQAHAVGLELGKLHLQRFAVSINALRREQTYYEHPNAHMKIIANDILLLHGTAEKLDQAEQFLLSG